MPPDDGDLQNLIAECHAVLPFENRGEFPFAGSGLCWVFSHKRYSKMLAWMIGGFFLMFTMALAVHIIIKVM